MSDVDDILASLESDPPAQSSRPAPAPAPATPAHVVAGTSRRTILEFAAVVVVTVTLTVGLTAWWLGPRDSAPKPTNAVALGRSFAPLLAGSLADGFDEGATLLRAGKTLGEADAQLKAKFDAGRKAAFDQHASNAIHAIAADGAELDPSQREAMINLFAGFAKGLREAR